MITGSIYKIVNDVNNKVYVGKTLNTVQHRFLEHCHDSTKRTKEHRPLYTAMRKYGVEHFHIELIEICPIEDLSDRECYWIHQLDSYNNGYNATLGGDGTVKLNYQAIINGFLSGKLIKQLAQEFECSTDAIHDILVRADIDPTTNGKQFNKDKYGQAVSCWDPVSHQLICTFKTTGEAIDWLIANKYTTAKNKNQIVGNIGRVIHQQRKTAFGFIWTSAK